MNWLRKRHQDTSPAKYLFTSSENKRCEEIFELFKKLDTKKRGVVDINQFHELLVKNEIVISKNDLWEMFNYEKPKGSPINT